MYYATQWGMARGGKSDRRYAARLTLAGAAIVIVLMASALVAAPRPWAAQDSVSVRYIAVDPSSSIARHLRTGQSRRKLSPVVVSRNGEYFFFLSNWGELSTDSEVNQLSVYRVRSVLDWLSRPPKDRPHLAPEQSVVFRSYSPAPAIIDAAWDKEVPVINFLGQTPQRTMELYRLDVRTGILAQVTHSSDHGGGGVFSFSLHEGGLLYRAQVTGGSLTPAGYPAEWVQRRDDGSIWDNRSLRIIAAQAVPYAAYDDQPAQLLRGELSGALLDGALWFSPQGRRAIGLARDAMSDMTRGEFTLQFVRVDLSTAHTAPLGGVGAGLTSPYPATKLVRPRSMPFWSADGSRVILVNAVPPGRVRTFESARTELTYLIECEITTGKWRALEPLVSGGSPGTELPPGALSYVSEVGWLKPGEELLVIRQSKGRPAEGAVYSFTDSGVRRRTVGVDVAIPQQKELGMLGGLSVWVEQGANEPPQMIASDGKRQGVLSEPDPALHGVQIQPMTPFHWREPDGAAASGGLTLPRAYVKGRRIPLVIQSYYYEPTLFLPDGPNRASDAAQALAARGMAVLQIDFAVPGANATSEGKILLQRIESAVHALAEEGIADPDRVGVTGFSRAGYQIFYVVTHPQTVRLAAAVGSDFFSGTYPSYLMDAATAGPSAAKPYERDPGGPFSENKIQWLEYEPTFNVDRVQAPFLVTRHGYESADDGHIDQRDARDILPIIGAFALNRKPLEYLYLGRAGHQLVRPLERLAEMEAVVDWMGYWLQGYEDPSPHKVQQYARWRSMRAMQSRSSAAQVGAP